MSNPFHPLSCLCAFVQPVEFCSDVFLLPLGEPHYDSIDLSTNNYVKYPSPSPPGPPTNEH